MFERGAGEAEATARRDARNTVERPIIFAIEQQRAECWGIPFGWCWFYTFSG
jgi:hypothetical protein